VALSPDGAVLAWALNDNTIQLIDLANGTLLHTLASHTGLVTRLRFSPAGDRLYSASQDGWVRAWDMTGQEVGAFQPQAGSAGLFDIEGLAVSPDGKLLATVPMDGAVTLWDASDFDLIRPLGANGGYAYSAVGFSPDGQLLVAGTVNGLYLWRTIDGTELLGGNPGINSDVAAFSPDGRYLAYAEIAEQYDLVLASPDGSQELRRWAAHTTPIWELFFSPDTTLLVSAGVETRLWRVDTGELVLVGAPTCP
jgi:WD40 repeat protein